jgi:hypothetical protein
VIALVALVLAGATAAADPPKLVVRASADPIVFAIGGYSVASDVTRTDTHWRLELGAFHARVPAPLVPIVALGPPGLVVDEDVVRVAGLYDLDAAHGTGFFFGPALYLYRLHYRAPHVTRDDDDPRLDAVGHEVYLHGTVGAAWFPLAGHVLFDRFFVMPWATVGVPLFHGADVVRGGAVVVRDRIVNWHATVSLGVRVW